MGDIINSAFVLEFIKDRYPNAVIHWFCEEVFAPILQDHPCLDAIHTVNLKQIKKERSLFGLFKLRNKLKALGPYEIVIDLQGLIKSALLARYLGKKRFGFDKHSIRESLASLFYQHKCSISYAENSIWRTAVLVNFALDLHITKEMITHKKPSLAFSEKREDLHYLLDQDAIVFVVGSSQPYKNYPIEKIIQTIELFKRKILLIWGSLEEYEAAKTIAEQSSYAIVAPKLNLNELKTLIAHTALTIGNDTGPTHIAWALNKPSITLFGATSAAKMMWETKINFAIESSSLVDPLKIDKQDFSIENIEASKIKSLGDELLHG